MSSEEDSAPLSKDPPASDDSPAVESVEDLGESSTNKEPEALVDEEAKPDADADAPAQDKGESEEEDEEEEEEVSWPVSVLYCGVCGLPGEYCEFGPDFEACVPWLKKYAPKYLIRGPQPEGKTKKKSKAKKKVEEPTERKVVISKAKRGNKKWVTSVEGLGAYGLDLKAVAMSFKKQLGVGATMNKKEDRIDAQGDVLKAMVALLQKKFKIPEEDIELTKKEGKVKSRGGGNSRPKGGKGRSRAARAQARATKE